MRDDRKDERGKGRGEGQKEKKGGSAPDAEEQKIYAMQVVNLVNIARRIRGGEGEAVASEIVETLGAYLEVMASFDDSPLAVATFYAGGKLMREAGQELPREIAMKVEKAMELQKEVLSDDCYKLTSCTGGARCVQWPTSLRPVDVNTKDEVGWRYIKDSHCGFEWTRPWRECGEPLGLYQCQIG